MKILRGEYASDSVNGQGNQNLPEVRRQDLFATRRSGYCTACVLKTALLMPREHL